MKHHETTVLPRLARRQALAWALGLGLRRGAPALLLGLAAAAQARRYEGQEFDETIELGGARLQLNGVGMRAVAILKGYLAALYLSRPAATPEAVYATPGPKRIQLRMLLEVSTEEFVKAVNKGVARNCSEAEQAALADQLPPFIAQMRAVGKVRQRDRINMDFVPGQGTSLLINGKPAGPAVGGAELYLGLLKVFLGQRPTDKRLKAGLLGQADD